MFFYGGVSMLLLNLLLASAPIMSDDEIYREANRCFGSNFASFQEMGRVNPVVFSELANSLYDPHKIAFLKMIAAKRGCEESRVYLETTLGKEINYAASQAEEAQLIGAIARKIMEIRATKTVRPAVQETVKDPAKSAGADQSVSQALKTGSVQMVAAH